MCGGTERWLWLCIHIEPMQNCWLQVLYKAETHYFVDRPFVFQWVCNITVTGGFNNRTYSCNKAGRGAWSRGGQWEEEGWASVMLSRDVMPWQDYAILKLRFVIRKQMNDCVQLMGTINGHAKATMCTCALSTLTQPHNTIFGSQSIAHYKWW